MDFSKYSKEQLGKAYEEIVGYNPFEDDAGITTDEVVSLMKGYDEEAVKAHEQTFAGYFSDMEAKSAIGRSATLEASAIESPSKNKARSGIEKYRKNVQKYVNQVGEITAETIGLYTIRFGNKEVKVPRHWVQILPEVMEKGGDVKFAVPEVEKYNGYELRTTPNGQGFVTLIYKGAEAISAAVSDLVKGGKTSIEKAKAKVNAIVQGKYAEGGSVDTIPEIVKRAMTQTVTNIGQLTPAQKKDLEKFVKKGVLIKGLGGPFPKEKTVYAIKGFDIAADRASQVNQMLGDLEKLEPGKVKRMEDGGQPSFQGELEVRIVDFGVDPERIIEKTTAKTYPEALKWVDEKRDIPTVKEYGYQIIDAAGSIVDYKYHFAKGGQTSSGKNKMPEKGTPQWHQLQIAKKTLSYSDAGAMIMGGMTKEEAKTIVKKYSLDPDKYEKGGEVKIPNDVFYVKIRPLRESQLPIYARISPDSVGEFVAGYVLYNNTSSKRKAGYLKRDKLIELINSGDYTIISKAEAFLHLDKYEEGGAVSGQYYIKVTPANTKFSPHAWKEGGLFDMQITAEKYADDLRKTKDLYDNRKKMYSKVEVLPATQDVIRLLSTPFTEIPTYSGKRGQWGLPEDESQMNKWVDKNLDKVDADTYFTDAMKRKYLKGLYYSHNKMGGSAIEFERGGMLDDNDELNITAFQRQIYPRIRKYLKEYAPDLEVWKNLTIRDKKTNHVYRVDSYLYQRIGGKLRGVVLRYVWGQREETFGEISVDFKINGITYDFPSLNLNITEQREETKEQFAWGGQVVGEKRARDIAKYFTEWAEQGTPKFTNSERSKPSEKKFPYLKKFAEEGFSVDLVLPCLEEIKNIDFRVSYEDKNRLRNYFEQYIPSKEQVELMKKNPGKYSKGGLTYEEELINRREQFKKEHQEEFKEWAKKKKIEWIDEAQGFSVGDKVTYTNDYGVVWPGHTIIGIDKDDSFYGRQFYLDTASYWFPHNAQELRKEVPEGLGYEKGGFFNTFDKAVGQALYYIDNSTKFSTRMVKSGRIRSTGKYHILDEAGKQIKELDRLGVIDFAKEQGMKFEDGGEAPADEKVILEFVIPDWAASALVNDDYSGLTDEDEVKVNAFTKSTIETYGNAHFSPASEDEYELGFHNRNDIDNLGANCVMLLLIPTKEYARGGIANTFDKALGQALYYIDNSTNFSTRLIKSGRTKSEEKYNILDESGKQLKELDRIGVIDFAKKQGMKFENGGRVENADVYFKDEGDFIQVIFMSPAAKERAKKQLLKANETNGWKMAADRNMAEAIKYSCKKDWRLSVDDSEIDYNEYAAGGNVNKNQKKQFSAYVIKEADEWGRMSPEFTHNRKRMKYYIHWYTNGWELKPDLDYIKKYIHFFDDEEEMKKAVEVVRRKYHHNINKDDVFYKEYLPVSEKTSFEKGGTAFQDKVDAISNKLEGTKVPAKYRKDYGKTYGHKDAETAARRIAGAMVRDEKMGSGGEAKLLPEEYYKTFHLRGNGRRGYNIFQSHSDSELRQAARQLFPDMSYSAHNTNALKYLKKAKEIAEKWVAVKNKAGKELIGEDYQGLIHDKVSGIGRDEFPEDVKNELRSLIKKMNEYEDASRLHNAMLLSKDKIRSYDLYAVGGDVDSFTPMLSAVVESAFYNGKKIYYIEAYENGHKYSGELKFVNGKAQGKEGRWFSEIQWEEDKPATADEIENWAMEQNDKILALSAGEQLKIFTS